MKPQAFVFFGIVGSGKGTQVKLLMNFLKYEHNAGLDSVYAGTGEGFRALVASGSYTGSLVKEVISRGELVADFLRLEFWSNDA